MTYYEQVEKVTALLSLGGGDAEANELLAHKIVGVISPPHPLEDPTQQRSIQQAEVALRSIVRRASMCDACGRPLSEEGCEYRQEWSRKVHTIVGGNGRLES